MYITVAVLAVAGAIAGGLIGRSGQCTTGACPLTSSPVSGAIYGALVGAMLGWTICLDRPCGAGCAPRDAGTNTAASTGAAELTQLNTDKDFDRKITSNSGVNVVVFYTDWCGVCKSYFPRVRSVAGTLQDSVSFYKMDAESEADIIRDLEVTGVPTTIVTKDGVIKHRFSGLMEEQELRRMLSDLADEGRPADTESA